MDTNTPPTAKQIAAYFLANRFSNQVERDVQLWLVDDAHEQQKEDAAAGFWHELDAEAYRTVHKDFQRVLSKIEAKSSEDIINIHEISAEVQKNKAVKRGLTLRHFLPRIAALLIPAMLIIGGYMIYTSTGAGEKAATEFAQVTVAQGEERQLTLPDGSEAVVGEGSTLQFAQSEDGKSRIAHLSGKAQFSVKKDDNKPFIVHTDHLKVTVLGTNFNVNSYPQGQKATVALTSGKVSVEILGKQYALSPGEQLEYDTHTHEVAVTPIASAEASVTAVSLNFAQATLTEIFAAIESKYHVKVTADTRILSDRDHYCVSFDDSDDLKQVMGVLKDLVDGFSYKIDQENVIVRKR